MAVKTVVSVDLVCYSPRSALLDDIAGPAAVASFEERIQGIIDSGLASARADRSQVLVKTTGDGAILAFDHPSDLHHFAAGVYAAMGQHNAGVSQATSQLWFRIGASTREVHGKPGAGDIAGAVVSFAVRLENAAQPGQLVIDLTTFDGLKADQKLTYGPEETVVGKHNERFRARRTTFIPQPPSPPPPPPLPAWRFALVLLIVVGLTGLGTGLLALLLSFISRFNEVPFMGRWVISLVPLGVGLFAVNTWRARQVFNLGRARQEEGISELTRRLLRRLYQPELMTARSVRGLALGIEQQLSCPLLTDKLIIEAIRAAALDLEGRLSGRALVEALGILNKLLLEIDADARPLLSLASIDRLNAFMPSQLYLMAPLLAGVLALGFGRPLFGLRFPPLLAYPLCVLLLLAQAGLLISNIRLAAAWRSGRTGGDASAQASVWLDVFRVMMTSRNRALDWFMDCIWGPIWEMVLTVTTSPGRFIVMHEFRYKVARGLWRRLRNVQDQLDEIPPLRGPELDLRVAEFRALCRELWVVTGEKRFREIEARGHFMSEDLDNRVIHYL